MTCNVAYNVAGGGCCGVWGGGRGGGGGGGFGAAAELSAEPDNSVEAQLVLSF